MQLLNTKTYLTLMLLLILSAGSQQVIAVGAAMAEQDTATQASENSKDNGDALDKDGTHAPHEKDEDDNDYSDDTEDEDDDDEDDDDEDDDEEDDDDKDDDDLATQADPSLTAAEAEAIALAAVPGDVTETELELEDNRLVYEVEIGNQEVLIDANSGELIAIEIDD